MTDIPESTGNCENCGQPLTVGQVVFTWNDAELHAECEQPYNLKVEHYEESPAPTVLLGDPLLGYPLPIQPHG